MRGYPIFCYEFTSLRHAKFRVQIKRNICNWQKRRRRRSTVNQMLTEYFSTYINKASACFRTCKTSSFKRNSIQKQNVSIKSGQTLNTLIQFSPKRKIPRIIKCHWSETKKGTIITKWMYKTTWTNKINNLTPINIKAEHMDKQTTLTFEINPTNPPTLS